MSDVNHIAEKRAGGKARSLVAIEGNKAKVYIEDFFALIPADIADKASLFKWSFRGGRPDNKYVSASTWIGNGKKSTMFLHHLVLPKKPGFTVDHIDGNKLNNTRENLRYATRAQNGTNGKPRKRPGSPDAPVGVTFDKSQGKWRVRVKVDGKTKHVGWFADVNAATFAARNAHLAVNGEFSCYGRQNGY